MGGELAFWVSVGAGGLPTTAAEQMSEHGLTRQWKEDEGLYL